MLSVVMYLPNPMILLITLISFPQDMISNLKQLKQSTITIEKSLKESLELQISLETERSTYKDIARYGSRLYFAINDLAKLNHCYRFSVPAFLRIYSKNLHLSDKVFLKIMLFLLNNDDLIYLFQKIDRKWN